MNKFSDANLLDIIDMLPDPILLIDLNYTVTAINEAARKFYACSDSDLKSTCYSLRHQSNQPCKISKECLCPIDEIKKLKKAIRVQHKHRDHNGCVRHLEIHMRPLFDAQGEISGFLEISHDITPYIHMQEKLKAQSADYYHSSIHDPLTRLPNRRLLMDRMEQAVHRKTRSKETFGLFFLDLDHFKEINDTLGHAAGDKVLIEVGQRFKKRIRKGDTVARTGGDEFVLIIENGASIHHFNEVARKILKDFSRPFRIQDQEVTMSCSIGISLFPQDDREIEVLFHYADLAMYRAKQLGRNQYAFYDDQHAIESNTK
jgi:diguanylate cyclase (GGDEF)-like protein/PAS domain S-box-containing protein